MELFEKFGDLLKSLFSKGPKIMVGKNIIDNSINGNNNIVKKGTQVHVEGHEMIFEDL